MPDNHYTREELIALGVTVGDDVVIDRSVRLFGADKISIGSNVRIDCFGVISAREPVSIGSFVHLAAGVYLFGAAGISLGDYVGLSSRVAVYSVSDDYSEGHLVNPTVPDSFRKVRAGRVVLQDYSLVGAGSIILPGVNIGVGASVGALSLVNKSVPDYCIVSGTPLAKIGMRNKEKLQELAQQHKVSLGIAV